jgi:hypothetical protein
VASSSLQEQLSVDVRQALEASASYVLDEDLCPGTEDTGQSRLHHEVHFSKRMDQLRGPPSPTMDQIVVREDILRPPPQAMKLGGFSNTVPVSPDLPSKEDMYVRPADLDRDFPLVAINGSAARLSSSIRGYHAHASRYSKPIKRCFLSGVKMEMVVINPSHRDCFSFRKRQ